MCRSLPPKNPSEIARMLEPNVKSKKPWALTLYAEQLYLKGNVKEAMKYYQEAFQLGGSCAAACSIGKFYEEGLGVPRSLTKALEYYEHGIKMNDSDSMCNAAYILMTYPPKNERRAVELWERSATIGDRISQHNIAMCYFEGNFGLTANKATAFKWYKLSADNGYQRAIYKVGDMFDDGVGTTKDPSEALKYFRLATKHLTRSDKNYKDNEDYKQWGDALHMCGAILCQDFGNLDESLNYYLQAAVQYKNDKSMRCLAKSFHAGGPEVMTAPKNNLISLYWYKRYITAHLKICYEDGYSRDARNCQAELEKEVINRCNCCGNIPAVTTSLKRCTKCKLASYCNADCQKKDWPNHKGACTSVSKWMKEE
jgi:TPR repeat protein